MSVLISATDLRDATRKSIAVRADALTQGMDSPHVLLAVEVIIEADVASAFARLDSLATSAASSGALRYVGTARGLTGYISDLQRLGIADGVALRTDDEDHVIALMLDEMAPGLGSGRRHAA